MRGKHPLLLVHSPPRTVNELVHHRKVVLDRFFIYLSEVGFANVNEPIAELEHERCIRVGP